MTTSMRMNTCRFCGKQEFGCDATDKLVQYATRSYAHHRCYLERGKMLTDLRDWQIVNFPYKLLKEFDLSDFAIEAMQRIKESERKWEAERAARGGAVGDNDAGEAV